MSGVAVCGPKVLCVSHAAYKMRQAFTLRCRGVVDEDQVEVEATHFIVFESPQHLFSKSRVVGAVNLHKQDGEVAADTEAPERTLRQLVLSQNLVAMSAQSCRLSQVLCYVAVETHLRSFQ